MHCKCCDIGIDKAAVVGGLCLGDYITSCDVSVHESGFLVMFSNKAPCLFLSLLHFAPTGGDLLFPPEREIFEWSDLLFMSERKICVDLPRK